uniref:Uncharacterized protein n=1 Tax=Callorhinchus milii TaxID=7868 RepID=A0A4W3HGD9_CALMI
MLFVLVFFLVGGSLTLEADREQSTSSLHSSNGEKPRNSADYPNHLKKKKTEESGSVNDYESDDDKSDDNLVVDVSNEEAASPHSSPSQSAAENGLDKLHVRRKNPLNSPTSLVSSSSTPPLKGKEPPGVSSPQPLPLHL